MGTGNYIFNMNTKGYMQSARKRPQRNRPFILEGFENSIRRKSFKKV